MGDARLPGPADGAKWVMDVENGWHDLVLGKPAELVALGAGFSPASTSVIGMIAAKVGLPGDDLFKSVCRLLQYTGIPLGVVSGATLIVKACISSLAHDLLAEAIAKEFRNAIGHVLPPVRSVVRPIPITELGPDGARARQFHSDLLAAIPRQRAHEVKKRELAQKQRQTVELAAQKQQAINQQRLIQQQQSIRWTVR